MTWIRVTKLNPNEYRCTELTTDLKKVAKEMNKVTFWQWKKVIYNCCVSKLNPVYAVNEWVFSRQRGRKFTRLKWKIESPFPTVCNRKGRRKRRPSPEHWTNSYFFSDWPFGDPSLKEKRKTTRKSVRTGPKNGKLKEHTHSVRTLYVSRERWHSFVSTQTFRLYVVYRLVFLSFLDPGTTIVT